MEFPLLPFPPLFTSWVQAGFPSPADDWIEDNLDLHQHLVKHPSATYFLRVKGDSMIGSGIHEADLLIVDRSLKPAHNDVIVAALNGEITVKRLFRQGGIVRLDPDNPRFNPILINEDSEFIIWGVVTSVVHNLRVACSR